MNSNELYEWAQKLSKQGIIDHLENGKEAISVSLMLPQKLEIKSRDARREHLKNECLDKLNDLIPNNNIEIDFNSVSPSAQTIQAKLGIDDIHSFLGVFEQRQVEVYPNTKKSIIE